MEILKTILTDITPDNPIFDQEMFGPVASVYKVASEEEAIALANNSSYGLGNTVFSQDYDHAERVAAQIETGMSWINAGWASLPELPFGGVKNSGYGRELSSYGIEEFMGSCLPEVLPGEGCSGCLIQLREWVQHLMFRAGLS